MKLNIEFTTNGGIDYQSWKKDNKKVSKRIDKLINDSLRHPFTGLGEPEPLRHQLSGKWSRRINGEHRLVYGLSKDRLIIY